MKSRRSAQVHEALTLLEKWARFKRVCYAHDMAMAGLLGLIVNELKHPELRQRLSDVHSHRLEIGNLKTDAKTYMWFRKGYRPV